MNTNERLKYICKAADTKPTIDIIDCPDYPYRLQLNYRNRMQTERSGKTFTEAVAKLYIAVRKLTKRCPRCINHLRNPETVCPYHEDIGGIRVHCGCCSTCATDCARDI